MRFCFMHLVWDIRFGTFGLELLVREVSHLKWGWPYVKAQCAVCRLNDKVYVEVKFLGSISKFNVPVEVECAIKSPGSIPKFSAQAQCAWSIWHALGSAASRFNHRNRRKFENTYFQNSVIEIFDNFWLFSTKFLIFQKS